MPSLFRRKPSHRITSLFKELFSELVEANPDTEMGVAIAAAAEESGMADYDVEAIALRLIKFAEEAEQQINKANAPKGPRKEGSGFAKGFTEWVSGLNTEKLCLWLAEYDLEHARRLYCDTDIDDLKIMVDLKTGQAWQSMRAQFEACVLGFGGKLQGQGDATVHEVNMNDNASVQDMMAQMRNMGF